MKKLKTLLFFFLFAVALMINGALQAQNSPVKNSVLKARALEMQKKINEDHKKKIKTRA